MISIDDHWPVESLVKSPRDHAKDGLWRVQKHQQLGHIMGIYRSGCITLKMIISDISWILAQLIGAWKQPSGYYNNKMGMYGLVQKWVQPQVSINFYFEGGQWWQSVGFLGARIHVGDSNARKTTWVMRGFMWGMNVTCINISMCSTNPICSMVHPWHSTPLCNQTWLLQVTGSSQIKGNYVDGGWTTCTLVPIRIAANGGYARMFAVA